MRIIDGIRVWGEPDEATLAQAKRCNAYGDTVGTCLMADAHKGYSMPIGGVIAYENSVSPSGVGYDIACGIMAVETDIMAEEISPQLPKILDDIARNVAFGLGRTNPTPIDHPLFDHPLWDDEPYIGALKDKAAAQLGTVGSGNHFVDLLEDNNSGRLWVAAHFGSRGLGHSIASGFLNLAAGRKFHDRAPGESMDQDPTLLSLDTDMGQTYVEAMRLAGEYAYAGREYVINQVLEILGGPRVTHTVHNHHNYAWEEEHEGRKLWVVRKGATPAFPGQQGFVGGSMADIAAVVEGIDTKENEFSLRSTVHGAGRIMSRSQAKGRFRRGKVVRKGSITRQMMAETTKQFGVLVRGGDVDEAPHVYRKLRTVLDAHADSIRVKYILRPIGVVMAGADVKDPYKD